MDLRTFVGESLLQIMQGIYDAQQSTQDIGGSVQPAGARPVTSTSGEANSDAFLIQDGVAPFASTVRFDVALTVAESGSSSTGGKLSVFRVSLERSGSSESLRQESVSRIQFAVPVRLPNQEGVSY